MPKQKTFATITLIGRDKAGVVAGVTQELFRLQANIEGLEEQVRRGEFSMTLQASWADGKLDMGNVRAALGKIAKNFKMELKLHFSPAQDRQRMAIFVTKESHPIEAILQAVKQNKIKAHPILVVSNHRHLKPIATHAGISFAHVNYADRNKAETEILKLLEKHEIDFIVLARFMKILSPNFVWRWKNKILNIHPSLLPAFPGASAYRQAFEKGVKIVGVTAHFVTPDLDEGPIICQEGFRTKPGESLESIIKRGQKCESSCLVKAIRTFLQKRLDVHWGKVYGV